MDKSKQEDRQKIWKDFQYSHSGSLLTWGEKHQITGNTDFVLSEVFSRVVGVKAMKLSSATTISQAPLEAHYDLVVDGGTRIDIKFRTNDVDDYLTDKISESKIDFAEADQILCILWSGECRLYDSHSFRNKGPWKHSNKTAVSGKTITDGFVEYYPDDAIWTSKISLPNEFK